MTEEFLEHEQNRTAYLRRRPQRLCCGAYAQCRALPAPGRPPAAQAVGDAWPKTAQLDGATYTVYQPQLDSWDTFNLAAHAAVSVLPPGSQAPVFGVLKLTAKTKVDRLARTVYFTDTTVQSAIFPSASNWATSYQQAFQALFVKGPFTVALDRMEAALAVLNAQNQAKSVPVQNPVPQFVFSTKPAVLVTIDGDPAWRPRRRDALSARAQHATAVIA